MTDDLPQKLAPVPLVLLSPHPDSWFLWLHLSLSWVSSHICFLSGKSLGTNQTVSSCAHQFSLPFGKPPLHPSHWLTSNQAMLWPGSPSSFPLPHRPLSAKCSCCHLQGMSPPGSSSVSPQTASLAPNCSPPHLLSTHLIATGAVSPSVVRELSLPLYFFNSEISFFNLTCKSTRVLGSEY